MKIRIFFSILFLLGLTTSKIFAQTTAQEWFEKAEKESYLKQKIKLYDQCIALNPKNLAEVYKNRGNAKLELEQYEEADKDYLKALEINPKYARALGNRGLVKYNLKNYQEAIQLYSQAIELDTTIYQIYYNRGNVYDDLKQYRLAIKDYDKAIKLNSNEPKLYYYRGNLEYSLGEKKEAIKDYDKAIEINSKFISAYINRGNAKYDLGKKEEAIEDYNKAFELNPIYSEAYYNRAISKSYLGDKEESIKDYTRAILLDPNYSEAYYNRGSLKRTLGKNEEAIQDITKALQLDSTNYLAYAVKGQCLYQLKKYNDAIDAFNKANRLNKEWWSPKSGLRKSALALPNPENPPELEPKTNKRIALVIGNSTYQSFAQLGENPINDASDLAKVLKDVGFDSLYLKNNLNKAEFDSEIEKFIAKAKKMNADVATLYYAGHGVEINGVQYWVPIDANPQNMTQYLISTKAILQKLGQAGIPFKVIFSDACRNNPFHDDNGNVIASRAIYDDNDRGMGSTNTQTNSSKSENRTAESNEYTIFATYGGKTASNGYGRNGLFTSVLKSKIQKGKDIYIMVTEVSKEIEKYGQTVQFVTSPNNGFEW